MASELLTPDTVTIEGVRDVYEAAYTDVVLDEETGQLRIREDLLARAFLSEARDRLQLVAYYGIKDDAQRVDRLELANRVNDQYVMIRAGIDDDGDLWFDYTISLKGGVTPKAVVQATRMFLMLVPRAVHDCDDDGIVE